MRTLIKSWLMSLWWHHLHFHAGTDDSQVAHDDAEAVLHPGRRHPADDLHFDIAKITLIFHPQHFFTKKINWLSECKSDKKNEKYLSYSTYPPLPISLRYPEMAEWLSGCEFL